MLRKKKHNSTFDRKVKIEHTKFYPYLEKYLESRLVLGFSEETNKRYDSSLRRFIAWCDSRDIEAPQDVTRQVIEGFQRHLHYLRKSDGSPMNLASQVMYLTSVRSFFKWLAQQHHILYNPSSEMILPKRPKTLPRALLDEDAVRTLMNQPDITTPEGMRDRTILELFYSCGLRRNELVKMNCEDVNLGRSIVLVRHGKGKKERCLPIGESAMEWLRKYLEDVRDQLLSDLYEKRLFLTDYGEPFSPNQLGQRVKKHLKNANIEVSGGCHLLRHAMATHMLDNGADIRFIQAMLGHEDLSTTEIYTQVSIEKLREVHIATHPAKVKKEAENPCEPTI